MSAINRAGRNNYPELTQDTYDTLSAQPIHFRSTPVSSDLTTHAVHFNSFSE